MPQWMRWGRLGPGSEDFMQNSRLGFNIVINGMNAKCVHNLFLGSLAYVAITLCQVTLRLSTSQELICVM